MSETEQLNVSDDQDIDLPEVSSQGRAERGRLQLLPRLLMGTLLLSGDGFNKILKNAQEQVDKRPTIKTTSAVQKEMDGLEYFRYVAIGGLTEAQKRTRRGMQRGLNFSLKASGAVLGTFYALTDNSLMRPLQKPVDFTLTTIVRSTDQMIRVGRVEEEQSKQLTQETIEELTDELVDYISKNPKLKKVIQDVIGSQSIGMAQLIMDGINERLARVDYMVEAAVRKVFRMKPRSELPDSPIAGHPQYMYLPIEYIPDQSEA